MYHSYTLIYRYITLLCSLRSLLVFHYTTFVLFITCLYYHMVEYFVNDASTEDLLHNGVFIKIATYCAFTIGFHAIIAIITL